MIPVIGWREWVGLPDLGVPRIKVKVDTGARTSALHAYDLEEFEKSGDPWIRFSIHPMQRTTKEVVAAEAPILEWRNVRSSSGHASRRPVIRTELLLAGRNWPIDLTLTARDEMGFRMLVGRRAVRHRFVVDPGRSYLAEERGVSSRNRRARAAGGEEE